MARLSRASKAILEAAALASEANPPPPLNVPLPYPRRASARRSFPQTFWERGSGRIKRPFGTGGLMLTLRQAQHRGLVAYDTTFRVLVPTCQTKAEEDHLLMTHALRAALNRAKAEEANKAWRAQQCR